jgi:hypothetical protein
MMDYLPRRKELTPGCIQELGSSFCLGRKSPASKPRLLQPVTVFTLFRQVDLKDDQPEVFVALIP